MEDLPLLRFVVVERIPYALVVIVLAWLAQRAALGVLEAIAERFTVRRLLVKQVSAVLRFVLVLVATALVVGSVLHLTDEVVLALGGSAAVAVGFAFKDLLASLMAGVILLFDRPFQVGDRILFDGTYGEVLEIGLRTVRIRTLDDNLVSVPNHRFLNDAVSCSNSGALHQLCVVDFFLASDQDFEAAMEVAYEAAASSRFAYLRAPIRVTMEECAVPDGQRSMALRIRAWVCVLDGRFELMFRSDVQERAKRGFRARAVRTLGEAQLVRAAPGGAPA